ncbi:MAG TPA: hypothetical protein DCL54_03315 [Alphaproteobacteria bacterium]|nr:hypothetical protein [Alphaproteobacteria bacterium]
MADGLIERRFPTDEEYAAAVQIVTDYIDDSKSGWDRARAESILKQLNDWQIILFHNRMTASHDAEKD